MITSVFRSRKSSMLLPLMFWNWAASVRSSAHSPCLPELHVADDGLERRLADVVGKLVFIRALGCLDRLAEHLQVGISPHRHVIAERIDAALLARS